jgi:hypothetical protein
MKKLALLASFLILAGCNEGSFWSGSLVAQRPMAVLNADGQVIMEIAAGSMLGASLYREPDRSWLFEFQDTQERRSAAITIPLQTSGLRYGRVYHLRNFGQNFEVSVAARLKEDRPTNGSRYEICHTMSYVCGYDWRNGEYQYVCEYKNLSGRQVVQFTSFNQVEIIEGEFFDFDGRLVGDFSLSRSLGLKERITSKSECIPNTY